MYQIRNPCGGSGFAFAARVCGHSLNGLRHEYGTLLPAHWVDETSALDMIDVKSFSDNTLDT